MKILELYKDYHITYASPEDKHYREGWVNIECPFCYGNPGYHLGYNMDSNHFHCWRCGGKFTDQVLSKILNVSNTEAEAIINKYGGQTRKIFTERSARVNLHPFKYPSGDLRLTRAHTRYLEQRGFDPDELVAQWDITGTGPLSFLDKTNYSKRIIAPIRWDNRIVSFQARDITGKHSKKYLACPKAREIVEHQSILYGNQSQWQRRGICVEGITDVWRLGPHSFATFGIDYTHKQVRAMKTHFDEIIVVFDPDPQAREQAKKLAHRLKNTFGIKAHAYLELDMDPGDLSPVDAAHLVRQIL